MAIFLLFADRQPPFWFHSLGITGSAWQNSSAARFKLGSFAQDLYPNYECSISGKCHLLQHDKCIYSLTLTDKFSFSSVKTENLIVQRTSFDPIDDDLDLIFGQQSCRGHDISDGLCADHLLS